jgi:hypothetical protein
MTDPFKMLGDGWNQLTKTAGREVKRIGREAEQNFKKDIDQIDNGIKKGGFLGGALEAADVFSVGHATANMLDNFNVIPEDERLKEGISAGVNVGFGLLLSGATAGVAPFALAGLALGAKDIADMVSVPGTTMAPAQSTLSPKDELKALKRAAREDAVARGIDAAKEHRAEESELARQRINAKRDGYAAGFDAGYQVGYDSGYADAIKRNDELFGPDKTGQVGGDIDRILNNPNLCFEDMIFELLRAVIKETQNDAKGMTKDLKSGRADDDDVKSAFSDKIKGLTEKLAAEKDPVKRDNIANELQNVRDARAEKLSARSESRADAAENIKNLLNKLAEMQQAMSNILNSMHESSMNAIRNIK